MCFILYSVSWISFGTDMKRSWLHEILGTLRAARLSNWSEFPLVKVNMKNIYKYLKPPPSKTLVSGLQLHSNPEFLHKRDCWKRKNQKKNMTSEPATPAFNKTPCSKKVIVHPSQKFQQYFMYTWLTPLGTITYPLLKALLSGWLSELPVWWDIVRPLEGTISFTI